MNVLFVFSSHDYHSRRKPLFNANEIHLGISYISSLLKRHGHGTRLLVLTRATSRAVVDEYIAEFKPGLMGFAAVYSEYAFMASIADYVKRQYPRIFLLAGGPHVSLNPEECTADAFDALCIGEGEYAVLELVARLEQGGRPSGIPGVWLKHDGDIERNPPRPFNEDLDGLPFPDRDMWKPWIAARRLFPSVLLSRGCPFNCPYCCNHALRRLSTGRYVRHRSPDNIVAEIDELAQTVRDLQRVNLVVETFATDETWALDVCRALTQYNALRAHPLEFGVNLRIGANGNPEPLFEAMQQANFKAVSFGIESGSERIRREVLGRNYTNEDVIHWVNLARQRGHRVSFYNMIGLPGETLADFRKTIAINRQCLPDEHILSIFMPYPGTALHQRAEQAGLLPARMDTEMERSRANLDLPGFSKGQIERSFVWFDYHVYRGHRPLWIILARVLARKLKTRPATSGAYRRIRELLSNPLLLFLKEKLMRF
ncbi:MAG TPA: B12-binding domain-containing radical SAM protein [Candidatus Hydrogenedentes bacterium]|nr:B12-binding domain-containing radical SAM protein [Candidatus Hydrogenedentota bacterium]